MIPTAGMLTAMLTVLVARIKYIW